MGEFEKKTLTKAIDTVLQETEQAAAEQLDAALNESAHESLRIPWIPDADTAVKLLYGHQTGTEIGHNPIPKWDGQVISCTPAGSATSVWCSMSRYKAVKPARRNIACRACSLNDLSTQGTLHLGARGDNAFGNEGVMAEMEGIEQHYLFKLRQTAEVKCLIERQWQQGEWQNVGQGFDAVEGELRLACWGGARRVVVRRRVKDSMVTKTSNESLRQALHFIDHSDKVKFWGYDVVVANTGCSLETIGQLYRDRADCENGFDKLKSQWGRRCYTAHDLERYNLSRRQLRSFTTGGAGIPDYCSLSPSPT